MKLVKPSSVSEKQTKTTLDTIEITPVLIATWKLPPFQREFRQNRKVAECMEQMTANGGVLPGIITLGVLDKVVYIVDGQHRLRAFMDSELKVGYADVRWHFFDSVAEMSDEFVKLNSQIVRLRPDDILRGLEASSPALQRLRKRCPFVGYDQVRRSGSSAVVSMSTFLRAWAGSHGEAPAVTVPATTAVQMLTDDETDHAIDFATVCFAAWQRDPEYSRLWSGINMMICAWLYRRIVLGEGVVANSRCTRYSKEDYRRGLLALSAESSYLEFLVGRNVSNRDRAPAYRRIKVALTRRYVSDHGKKPSFPAPPWSHGQ